MGQIDEGVEGVEEQTVQLRRRRPGDITLD